MPTKAKGDVIRRLREQRGLTCADLARAAGLDRTHLWKIENGKLDGSPEARLKIATYFDVDLDTITYFQPPRVKQAA